MSDPQEPENVEEGTDAARIDPKLLDILRCPVSHKPLVLKGDKLYCYESRKAYPIQDGLPLMLVDVATEIPESEMPETPESEAPPESRDGR